METIDSILQSLSSNFLSLNRDTVNAWYFLEIGIPTGWVYNGNDNIKCDVLNSTDTGMVLKISPIDSYVSADDLFKFVRVLIDTNKEISTKELEFTKKMEEMKNKLESEAEKFYKELDEMKMNSFNNSNDNKKKNDKTVPIKKETRGRPKKTTISTKGGKQNGKSK